MLSYCTDDILWTGAEQKEYIMGIEEVRKNFTELMNVIQPCIISNGEFIVVQNTGNACTVSGRYLVETLPEADYFLQAEQRCTFVWERINDEPRIRHMHVSNPIGEMKIVEGSRFVNEMGRMAKKYMDEKKFTEALKLSENRLAMLTPGDREYAAVWYNIGDVKNMMGDMTGFFEAMMNSAIEDMKHCIKDHASLHRIARTLYDWDEVSRAASYIQICMEDVYFYNANLRSLQIAKTLPVVTQAYEKKNQSYIMSLRTKVVVIFLLLFFCVGILIVVVVQKNKLSRMHRKLQESNDSLNVLSHKLADANTHLNEVNNELVENNYIKENYVAHFIRLSSEYIGKNQKFRLEVNKALRKGKVEDALRMTLYAGTDDEELEEFYANFDEAFLSIFPHFIEEYNKLMAEENRVVLTDKQKERKMLTSELRVFALIRLGFNDSATIARMLRYSINTIYNIRSKVKNKAIVSKDSFESLIMKIGMLSME